MPNLLMAAVHLCHLTQPPQDRLRLQHRADVASAAAGRGLRLRRHPDQGPHRVRRRPRLPHARGGDLRRADPATRPPIASCSRSRSRSSSRRSTTSGSRTSGKHYTLPPEVPYRGYTLKELTLVPRPMHRAGGDLAAGGQRQPARAGLHGQARHQGRGGRRRRDAAAGADHRLSRRGGARRARPAARREFDDRHLLPSGGLPRPRRCAKSPRCTRSMPRCSRRWASCPG